MTKKGPGRPRKHEGGRELKTLSLSPAAAEWLEQQPNQSAAIEALIQPMLAETPQRELLCQLRQIVDRLEDGLG